MSNREYRKTAHAKINLNLHVVGVRDDGYHNLQSLVVFTTLGDEISIKADDAIARDQLSISGPFAHLLSNDENNLILHATQRFRNNWPRALPSALSIQLQKNLPIAAGIGGGSSDAAAVLKILSEMSAQPIRASDLIKVAESLGADVPVCMNVSPTLMQGKGEQLAPFSQMPEMYAVLVNPLISVSTPEIFSDLKSKFNPSFSPMPNKDPSLLSFIEWIGKTRNDLGPAACERVPQIGEIIAALQGESSCLFAQMSGSGATVFGLFASLDLAQQAAKNIKQKWPTYWCKPTRIITSEA